MMNDVRVGPPVKTHPNKRLRWFNKRVYLILKCSDCEAGRHYYREAQTDGLYSLYRCICCGDESWGDAP